ncbi:hypothetical protein QO002_005176 [Pararhizobium capsulatum DSM 1112]|uniref:Glycosyltransferase RgtA/B/C/D-like domain-containing protein n=1 Tax=Pararhizobium capsulatum DSM 1112 TaxID=1121113 RepID=A0ABU0BZV6_9HYPH|nr:hypothetical protein [Pararhizobium capsulatum]MDQ0322970.1 hypothetical protein [Pararhizobium capsulatum DSM 1112]
MTNPIGRSVYATSLSSIADYVRDRLVANDEGRFWFVLAFGLGLISALSFEVRAFALPIDTISSDARMFLSWMGQWDNPDLLNGDFVADYWKAVSPWAYTGVFRLAWELGLPPVVFAKIIPALLLLLVPVFTFRFIRAINGEPLVAFLASAAVLHYLARAIVSGTPRDLWPILLLAILDGLARGRIFQTALAQLLLTGSYPQMAMATATMIGLTFLDFFPRLKADLSRQRIVLIAVCAMATITGILPFLVSSGGYAPSFSLAEALKIPTFQPGGRGQLFPANGAFNVLCGSRLSFLVNCNGAAILKPSLLVGLVLGGSIVLFLRKQRAAKGIMASNIPFLLMIASILWFILARAMLFRLHLPNRYTAATELLIYLTAFPLVVEWVRRRLQSNSLWLSRSGRRVLVGGAIILLIVCALGAVNVRVAFTRPNLELLNALRGLPETSVVGGFVEDLDFSPALTNRSTLFSRELAIAYQKGYFLPIMARMEAVKDIVMTHDPEVLVDRISALKITHLVIRQSDLSEARLPPAFRSFFDEAQLKRDEDVEKRVGSILSKLAPICTAGVYNGVSLISTTCLVEAAKR